MNSLSNTQGPWVLTTRIGDYSFLLPDAVVAIETVPNAAMQIRVDNDWELVSKMPVMQIGLDDQRGMGISRFLLNPSLMSEGNGKVRVSGNLYHDLDLTEGSEVIASVQKLFLANRKIINIYDPAFARARFRVMPLSANADAVNGLRRLNDALKP
jgi:hypothetical protein